MKPYLTPPSAVKAPALASLLAEITTTTTGTSANNTIADEEDGDTIVVQPTQLVKRSRGRPRKYPLDPADITIFFQDDQFQSSRHKEVVGLLEKGVFEVTDDIPEGVHIFKAQFVNEVKNKGTS